MNKIIKKYLTFISKYIMIYNITGVKMKVRLWNSTLKADVSKGLKRKTPLRQMSKKMKSRTFNWRKTAKEICTVDGVLYCPLCCKPITGNYVAHHYKERRGQAHNIDNDKYVVALHPWCHNNIDHYSDDFYIARTKIETILKKWRKL